MYCSKTQGARRGPDAIGSEDMIMNTAEDITYINFRSVAISQIKQHSTTTAANTAKTPVEDERPGARNKAETSVSSVM